MGIINYIKSTVFNQGNDISLKDFRLWLLLVVINCGANLGFNYYFEQQKVKIILFLICLLFVLNNKTYRCNIKQLFFVLSLCLLLFFQVVYLDIYSITTSLHYILMISIAVMTVSICGKQFTQFYSGIIFVHAVISLICYLLSNIAGVVIPYIPITSSNIDGGVIMRVYNLYYTQLGNPMGNGLYTIRNCGPFWEPGAFQGFLNLAIWFELTSNVERNKWWKFRVVILIFAVITTLSTGGYIVLFFILTYFFSMDKSIGIYKKLFFTFGMLAISCYLYFILDFMSQKISNDEARLNFSFTNFPNIFYMLFGYGYATESFSQSSMSSASSIFNLFRYLGVIGTVIYLSTLFFNKTPHHFAYFCVIFLILMNEPFLSNAMIWWAPAFVTYNKFKDSKSYSFTPNRVNES